MTRGAVSAATGCVVDRVPEVTDVGRSPAAQPRTSMIGHPFRAEFRLGERCGRCDSSVMPAPKARYRPVHRAGAVAET